MTYRVYDNAATINGSTPAYDANGDGMVWVEVITTYQGRITRVRQLVSSSTTVSILPKAAAYADTSITLSNTADIYGVNKDGTPDTSGAPYVTTIMAGNNFTATSSADLASPADSTHTQSLGLQVNGTVTTPGHNFSPVIGGVGLLSDYFDQAHQAALTDEAQSGMPTTATNTPTATTITSTLRTTLQGTVEPDLHRYDRPGYYNGSLTLSAKSGATSTFNFKSLYMTGDLTVTGNVTLNTTALYVGGNFTISGTSANITDQLGPIYCAGTIDWNGGTTSTRLAVKTTNYLDSSKAAAAAVRQDLLGRRRQRRQRRLRRHERPDRHRAGQHLDRRRCRHQRRGRQLLGSFLGHGLHGHVPAAGHDGADAHQRSRQPRHPDEADGLLHAVRQRRLLQQHVPVRRAPAPSRA